MISDGTKTKGFTKIHLAEEAKFGDDLLLNYMMQCGHAKILAVIIMIRLLFQVFENIKRSAILL